MRTSGNGTAELDRLITDLQAHTRHVIQERDDLARSVTQLERERDELAQRLAALEEKHSSYALIVREWMTQRLSPEEAEAIMRADQWVDFETVMRELDSVQDAGV